MARRAVRRSRHSKASGDKYDLQMANCALIIHDGEESHQITITQRDLGLLRGPLFDAGRNFICAFRIYDHFTAAGGVPKGSHVVRVRQALENAARTLHAAIERDSELLR